MTRSSSRTRRGWAIEAVRHVAKGEHQIRVECDGRRPRRQARGEGDPRTHPLRVGIRSCDQVLWPLRHGVPQEGHPAERHHPDRPAQHQAAPGGHRRLAPPGEDGSSRRSGSTARPRRPTSISSSGPASWTRRRFLDGIIINEFSMNNPSTSRAGRQPGASADGRRAAAAPRRTKRPSGKCAPTTATRTRCFYAYFGGSGKKSELGDDRHDVRPDPDRLRLPDRARTLPVRDVRARKAPRTPCRRSSTASPTGKPRSPASRSRWSSPSACSRCRPGGSTSCRTSITTSGWTSR